MTSVCYALLLGSDLAGALACTISAALPYSMAWLLIGMVIWGAVKIKTKGYTISSMILIIYMALLIPAGLIEVSIQPFIGLLLGLMIFIMLIMIITKKG